MEAEIYCCVCGEYIETVDLPEDELTGELLEESICEVCNLIEEEF